MVFELGGSRSNISCAILDPRKGSSPNLLRVAPIEWSRLPNFERNDCFHCLVFIQQRRLALLMMFRQVTFPNGVFSGTIISSIVKDSSLVKTAEYQLLLGSIALPGVFLGAYLCDIIGRKNTMMLGFSGYCEFTLSYCQVRLKRRNVGTKLLGHPCYLSSPTCCVYVSASKTVYVVVHFQD